MLGGILAVLVGDWLGQQFIRRMRRPARSTSRNTPESVIKVTGDHVDIQDDVTMT
jgi:hypothetical protein